MQGKILILSQVGNNINALFDADHIAVQADVVIVSHTPGLTGVVMIVDPAALILFLSFYIDKHYETTSKGLDKKKTFKHGILFPGLIVAVFCGLVLLEKHLSGTIILALIGMAIIFISGADIVKMIVTYGVPALLAGAVYLMTNEYALKRILTHNDENADVLSEAWQTTQGLYAIGSGGLLGMGIGDSNLKFNYVSEAHNDFIFTIWCEELGFIGAALVVGLFIAFVWRGFPKTWGFLQQISRYSPPQKKVVPVL